MVLVNSGPKQKSRLIAMVDTLGLPTVFFTHSAADLQWPELARLLDCDDPENNTSRSKAVMENPCLADWFFYHRIVKFMEMFYEGILKASEYWLRFEWQHRGSPHVHGVAWLKDAPNVEDVLSLSNNESDITDTSLQHVMEYINRTVTTINPAVLLDGSNVDDAPLPKTNPHVCNKPYSEIEDHSQDLNDLICHMSETYSLLSCLLSSYKAWCTSL